MSTTQSLQSCLMEPRDLMHQLLPPKSLLISFQKEKEKEKEKPQHYHSLSKPNKTAGQEPSYYVHPFYAKTSVNLSSKSLEMCTESLGTETGSGIDEFSLLASAVEEEEEGELQSRENLRQAKRQQSGMQKAKHGGGNLNFPPPLSSISGGGVVQVQTHREGGRLVMKAFSFSSACRFFQAERGEGRLRLSLLKQEDGGGEEESGGEEENVKEEGGSRVWSSSRCNGESSNSRSKRMQSLPFCVVGV